MTLVQDGQSARVSPAKLIARVALASLVFALAGCNGGTVDRHALKRDAEKVGSLATEGALLANDVSRGASTKSFARVHAQELSGAAADLEDSLDLPDCARDPRRDRRLRRHRRPRLQRLRRRDLRLSTALGRRHRRRRNHCVLGDVRPRCDGLRQGGLRRSARAARLPALFSTRISRSAYWGLR